MIKRILSKLENHKKKWLKVLGINGSCRNRPILKSQWLQTEKSISHPHHRLTLVGGSPPGGDSGTQPPSPLQLYHFSALHSGCLECEEGLGLPGAERAVSIPLAYPLART